MQAMLSGAKPVRPGCGVPPRFCSSAKCGRGSPRCDGSRCISRFDVHELVRRDADRAPVEHQRREVAESILFPEERGAGDAPLEEGVAALGSRTQAAEGAGEGRAAELVDGEAVLNRGLQRDRGGGERAV